MAVISGARGTLNVSQSLRKVDMADQILLLEPDAAPLTVLSKRLSKKPTVNPEFSWQEDALDARIGTQAGGATNSATTVNVTTGQGTNYGPQDLVLNTRTFEVIRVVSVATDALTVVRAQGGTSGTAMNDLDELIIIGSAAMEGDVSKAARSQNATKVINYTQIFRKPVESTETQIHSDQFTTENDWDYQKRKAGIEHMKDIEYAVLLGRGAEDSSGSQPRRLTSGVQKYITTNATAVGGTMTEASFFTALRGAFRYGSKTKLLLAAPLVVDVLNGYARSKVQIPDATRDTYGLKVMQYISPHGVVNVVTHWLLGDSAVYKGYGFLLDLEQIKYRYLSNSKGSRDTHLKVNIQAPDADTEKDEYLTEAGLEFGLQQTHAVLTGITG